MGKKIRVAVNGLGRIGRAFVRLAMEREEIDLIAVNDLGDVDNLAYLLKYDSAYGRANFSIDVLKEGEAFFLVLNQKKVRFFQQKDPLNLSWRELGIDVVVESTGFFESFEKAKVHLEAGAKRVVISAPAKGGGETHGETILIGVNEEKFAYSAITSNASCTTNSASPVIEILHKAIGVEKAMLSTVHAYTATQRIVDGPDKDDYRRGRAGAFNIAPSTTGAAIAVTKAIPELENKFDGIAFRVPVIAGSIADITMILKRDTKKEEINNLLRQAAGTENWQKVFAVTEEPLVSSDILGMKYASIADLSLTKVVGGNMVKVLAWYDNEMGYTNSLIEHVLRAAIIEPQKN